MLQINIENLLISEIILENYSFTAEQLLKCAVLVTVL